MVSFTQSTSCVDAAVTQAPQTAELVEPAGALAAIEALYSFVGESYKKERIVILMTTSSFEAYEIYARNKRLCVYPKKEPRTCRGTVLLWGSTHSDVASQTVPNVCETLLCVCYCVRYNAWPLGLFNRVWVRCAAPRVRNLGTFQCLLCRSATHRVFPKSFVHS